MLRGILFLGLLAAIAAGCYYDNEEELYEFYYAGNPCDTSMTSFSSIIFPIIQGNCSISGCHVAGGTGPGLFENYDQVKSFVDNGKLENRALVQRDMPPSGPLTNCQIALIQRWIDRGAPND